MPREMTYHCYTCGASEPHRQPRDDRERAFIRALVKKTYVEDYWICVTPGGDCRNIRYAWDDKPFDPPVKMPEPE
ncbi:hypothetical protein ACF1A5_12920 [Streptomyces sp. NPDC014864]|uniref:hypothetical protein n=1 Tax=Streptomyces sp. NPDC014864 TaxID=3364924 RepID=UPI0036F5781F